MAPTAEERAKTLTSRRAAFKLELRYFQDFLDTYDPSTEELELNDRIKDLEFEYTQFSKTQTELDTADETGSLMQERISLKGFYRKAHARAAQLLLRTNGPDHPSVTIESEHHIANEQSEGHTLVRQERSHSNSTNSQAESDNEVHLPKINLPTFNGRYEDWPGFADQFQSAIHDNVRINDCKKLMYLRSCLTGEAATMIASLGNSATNYAIAWGMLDKRYNKPSVIVANHVNALFDLPSTIKSTHNDLRTFLIKLESHYRALQALNQPTTDVLLIHLCASKLDKETMFKWKEHTQSKPFPSFDNFVSFLHERCQILEPTTSATMPHLSQRAQFSENTRHHYNIRNRLNTNNPVYSANRDSRPQPRSVYATIQNPMHCNLCAEPHYTARCNKLLNATPTERAQMIKNAVLCTNCFRKNHVATDCFAMTCKICHQKHHTLLHEDHPPVASRSIQANLISLCTTTSDVLLSTAVVNIFDSTGTPHCCRIILDSGSQAHFLTERMCTKLGLKRTPNRVPINGMNDMASELNYSTIATIKSRTSSFTKEISFLIAAKVSQPLPVEYINRSTLNVPSNIPLADPEFHRPHEIDGLIGAQLFWSLLCIGRIELNPAGTIAQKTVLGWIIGGEFMSSRISANPFCALTSTPKQTILEQQISKFWNIEELPHKKFYSPEETAAEKHYVNNTHRDPQTGKYIVKLPFKEGFQGLGDSYTSALKRLFALERTLLRHPTQRTQYLAFMREYEHLGHMSQVTCTTPHDGYYLPHHAVTKDSSLTTKTRVVFDGSARTTTNESLNDVLMTGPTIQDDLFSLILRFRKYAFVLTADISKMYRQILVHPDDRRYQRILWRESPDHPLKTYELNTVTYGTSSAPYLAIRSMHQLADDECHAHPIASEILKSDFYVDDLLTGANSYVEAEHIRDDLISLTAKGGLILRQWTSNELSLVNSIQNSSNTEHLSLNVTDTKKTLGIYWNPKDDNILYTVKRNPALFRITKRTMLSRIAELFDPLGLLGPVIVLAKLLMQKLWELQAEWDESVPVDIHTAWSTFESQLPLLHNIQFPRQSFLTRATNRQLHGFCDASERAYGACIYIRSSDEHGQVAVRLLCAKSRVASLKTQSLPRLELCSALLLTKLVRNCLRALKLEFQDVVLWSDSTIAISWIKSAPNRLKTFVANRVNKIQELAMGEQWRHISTQDNPADLISRGTSPLDFVKATIWQNGPPWLQRDEHHWPHNTITITQVPELRQITALQVTARFDLLTKYSSFVRLKRVISYCRRFVSNARRQGTTQGPLTATELDSAETCILKLLQAQTLTHITHQLNRNDQRTKPKTRHDSQSLTHLSPFLDSDGLIRVGGRLRHSDMNFSHKHPILLPQGHHLTIVIVREYHCRNGHSGTQATINAVRQRYWPIRCKNTVKQVIHRCITCHRAAPAVPTYRMADLPRARVTLHRPFLISGIDYCGPFFIKEKRLRNTRQIKIYVAIFICFATKAVHIEIVSDLTTEAFLATFKRFAARRGQPTDMYSDNATTFVGASRELGELYKFLHSEDHKTSISSYAANQGIHWHFIPPRSPHFGGLWEAAVKSFKYHMTRVIGKTLLSYEAFSTYATEVESILNSRPLTPLSDDPNDSTALTPSHFLIGDTSARIPEHNLLEMHPGRLSMWQHVQYLRQHFWKRWHSEYLHELTVRKKWHHGHTQDIKKGILVILREDNIPPTSWPLGRITDIHPGQDGTVRVATVKTSSGEYKRSVKRLAPLPIDFATEEAPV